MLRHQGVRRDAARFHVTLLVDEFGRVARLTFAPWSKRTLADDCHRRAGSRLARHPARTAAWPRSLALIMGNIPPPRDPDEDDDDEDEDSDTEPDEPAVIREPEGDD